MLFSCRSESSNFSLVVLGANDLPKELTLHYQCVRIATQQSFDTIPKKPVGGIVLISALYTRKNGI